jgi:hypothetical protein
MPGCSVATALAALALALALPVASAGPSVGMRWCYGSTTCAASCVQWTAADGVCYPGTNGAPAARVFVNTTYAPPRDAILVSYASSADCSGALTAGVFMPLDGQCRVAGSDSFTAVNSGAAAAAAAGGAAAAAVLLLAVVLSSSPPRSE